MSVIVTTITNDDEIRQILALQHVNHANVVSTGDAGKNGFVTVKHSFELLKKMNEAAPQVIAKSGEEIVGYALAMPQSFKGMIPVLKPMFDILKSATLEEKTIDSYSYYVMGQICISDDYRGRGIFDELYAKHWELYSDHYELCVTEVSERNPRSLKAHYRVGFKTVHTFRDTTDSWNILAWKWR